MNRIEEIEIFDRFFRKKKHYGNKDISPLEMQ